MSDDSILARISALVERERQLRDDRTAGVVDGVEQALGDVEVELDQCWDLLRQRRARREFGEDPEQAAARSAAVVEGYWQ
nr:DUF2630 family protein [uncultured Nocardioides sp.]